MQASPLKIKQLTNALAGLSGQFNGHGGNCAQVACALDEVLAAQGDFVVVSGEHYEFADHVFLRWGGLLWDIDGPSTIQQAQAAWCSLDEDEEDQPAELEDFTDPDHGVIASMADDNGIFAGGFDRARFQALLIRRLGDLGWDMSHLPQPTPTPKPPSP